MADDQAFKQPPKKERRFTKKDWDEIRFSFATSLMVDTKLQALAQNLELDDWPVRGDHETASKYIDFTWDELNDLPGLAGRPERVDHLIHILRETQSFDDPFGDMVATVDAAATKDDALAKNLKFLEIPTDYPLRYSGLTPETLEFCDAEDIKTIGEFARFSQDMAQNIIVGGDFRELLNAIGSADQHTLGKYIPVRPGHNGFYFPEAIGLLLEQLSESERYSLLKKYGYKLTAAEAEKARLSKERVTQLETIIVDRIGELNQFFGEQVKELYAMLQRGVKMERYFVPVNDPEKELICINVTNMYIERESDTLAAQVQPEKKRGFFAKLFGR